MTALPNTSNSKLRPVARLFNIAHFDQRNRRDQEWQLLQTRPDSNKQNCKVVLLSLIMTANGREEWVPQHCVSAEAKVADYGKRRLEIADEIAQLGEQQRQFVQNASVMGRRKGDAKYAERARRIAQLLTELISLEETYSVRAD